MKVSEMKGKMERGQRRRRDIIGKVRDEKIKKQYVGRKQYRKQSKEKDRERKET